VDTITQIILGLIAFDLFMLVGAYLTFRKVHMDRKSAFKIMLCCSGFIFHAFLFFEGAFLWIQLGFMACLFAMLFLMSNRQPATPAVEPIDDRTP
jgi:hypothetical protein